MQGDLAAIQKGIKVLSDARGEIDSICNTALRAVGSASGSNANKIFRNVEQEVTDLVNKMYAVGKDLINAGYTLSVLEGYIKELEGE